MTKKMKPVLAWGGFSGDKLNVSDVPNFDGYGAPDRHNAPAVFMSRKDARREYRDVRRVRITEVKP